jgi:hypothetical protein
MEVFVLAPEDEEFLPTISSAHIRLRFEGCIQRLRHYKINQSIILPDGNYREIGHAVLRNTVVKWSCTQE